MNFTSYFTLTEDVRKSQLPWKNPTGDENRGHTILLLFCPRFIHYFLIKKIFTIGSYWLSHFPCLMGLKLVKSLSNWVLKHGIISCRCSSLFAKMMSISDISWVKWWLDYIFNKVPLQMENCITNWSHTKCKIHWKGNLNTAYVYTLYFNQNLKLDDWHSLCIAPIKALN